MKGSVCNKEIQADQSGRMRTHLPVFLWEQKNGGVSPLGILGNRWYRGEVCDKMKTRKKV
jgi:hypothetical protein